MLLLMLFMFGRRSVNGGLATYVRTVQNTTYLEWKEFGIGKIGNAEKSQNLASKDRHIGTSQSTSHAVPGTLWDVDFAHARHARAME
jgi:hypothetical protein